MQSYEQFYHEHIPCLRIGSGSQAYGKCPLHQDNHSSFYCNIITGLWTCAAGCGVGNALTFSRRLGVSPPSPAMGAAASSSLTSCPSVRRATSKPKAPKKIVATYDYHDDNGAPIYQVVRFEPKSFAIRSRQGNAWAWGGGNVPRVPYRLPQVLKTDGIIFFVEGEKDVHKLESLHMVATTTPLGASAWSPDYAKWFRGKRVCVLPDNDPPGEAYAQNVASDITLHGGSAKLLRLPGLPEKGDVSDYLEIDKNSKETLIDHMRAAPVFRMFKPSNLAPAEYFASVDPQVIITPGSSLVPGEFQTYCDNAYKEVAKIMGKCTDAVFEKFEKLDDLWRDCRTESQYNQFLRALKEAHELSWQ